MNESFTRVYAHVIYYHDFYKKKIRWTIRYRFGHDFFFFWTKTGRLEEVLSPLNLYFKNVLYIFTSYDLNRYLYLEPISITLISLNKIKYNSSK